MLSPTDERLPAVLGIFYDNLSNYAGPTVGLHLHHIRCGHNLEYDQAEEEKVLSVQRGSWMNDCRFKREGLGFFWTCAWGVTPVMFESYFIHFLEKMFMGTNTCLWKSNTLNKLR